MAYLSFNADDHGLIEFGCNSYGGLAIRDSHPAYGLMDADEQSTSAPSTSDNNIGNDNEDLSYYLALSKKASLLGKLKNDVLRDGASSFITEHNLALFWRRAGLYPHTCGFSMPLTELSRIYDTGIRNRPPGNLRVDSPKLRHYQRNLLAGEWLKNTTDNMRLWAVNDLSDHRCLLTVPICVKDLAEHQQLVQATTSSLDGVLRLDLPIEALQLRAYESLNISNKVFVRTKHSLLLANTSENEMNYSTVFQTSLRSFTQIPYMEEEIAVVDMAGFVFYGDFGTPLSRLKSNLDVQQVCSTDCPRTLLLMANKEVVQSDLRVPNDAVGQPIFSLNSAVYNSSFAFLPGSSYEYTRSREILCHVNTVNVATETFLITTSRRHFLIDRRMPNRELLIMAHSEINGSDYLEITSPFKDPLSGGLVYSIYSLSHVVRPAISHWALMYHPNERLWSSLGAKYELRSPCDLRCFTNYHVQQPIGSGVSEYDLPKYTRAIYHQQLPHLMDRNSKRSLLFRQMDNGDIWYENVLFNSVEEQGEHNDSTSKASTANSRAFSSLDNVCVTQQNANFGTSPKQNESASSEQTTSLDYGLKMNSLKIIRRYFRKRNLQGDYVNPYIKGVDSRYLVPSESLAEDIDFRTIISAVKLTKQINVDPFSTVGCPAQIPSSISEELDDIVLVEKVENEERILSSIVVNMQNKTSELIRKATCHITTPIDDQLRADDNRGMEVDVDSSQEEDTKTATSYKFDDILDVFNDTHS